MVKSIKQGQWLINYEVHGEKIIKLLSAFKGIQEMGWQGRREKPEGER
ncbi:hypothetical protein [Calderihabitans maritimus]|uniref:Uncharacterized protein n=1 Tax=Calderihabitans maritimus TaxID=1246530 RepID=A0A1Z5HU82_9FIRM|nr:hypothetical protein [Calderihabitans maritimus]GAW93093.1 hypothetical protein KKC1_22340 [Calderihabitans maritimus]